MERKEGWRVEDARFDLSVSPPSRSLIGMVERKDGGIVLPSGTRLVQVVSERGVVVTLEEKEGKKRDQIPKRKREVGRKDEEGGKGVLLRNDPYPLGRRGREEKGELCATHPSHYRAAGADGHSPKQPMSMLSHPLPIPSHIDFLLIDIEKFNSRI